MKNAALLVLMFTFSAVLNGAFVQAVRTCNAGTSPLNPAASCAEIYESNPQSPSQFYYVQSSNGTALRVFCSMECRCGITGGWLRLPSISAQTGCPAPLQTITFDGTPICVKQPSQQCSSVSISTYAIPYSHVCGSVRGYSDRTPDAFRHIPLQHRSIDDAYVDGVSITHGTPRKHLWTYAAGGHNQVASVRSYNCPCALLSGTRAPAFVGENYYCDTRNHTKRWDINNPLWDGVGCPQGSSCCSSSGLPFFKRELPATTTDDIELRLCVDQPASDENVGIDEVEIYVRDCKEWLIKATHPATHRFIKGTYRIGLALETNCSVVCCTKGG